MSHNPTIDEMLINENSSIRKALESIDQNAQGTCFVVNDKKELVGVITDGDIRRAFISGKNLDSLVSEIMERNYTYLPVETPTDVIQSKISEKIRHVPLVDKNNKPVDYACYSRAHRIPVMTPLLNGNELAYVTECIKTGWISSQGAFVKKFEKNFGDFTKCSNALAVSNGTVAIHLALEALGIGPGDEVIVPDITFAASINAVIYCGATPVIADVDSETWTLSAVEIKKLISPRTKAIMPVHLYGHPCDMDPIMELAKQNNLFVVEDCAEALGTLYKGKHVGTFGDAGTFSFFGNKTITTGEGGMIIFKDEKILNHATVLRDHGMSKSKRYWHEFIGFNYRLTNMQAAIGVAQLERLNEFVNAKRKIASIYDNGLKKLDGITIPPNKDWAFNGYWLYTFLVDENFGVSRDELIEKMMKNGVETRPLFFPLHVMPPYLKYIKEGQHFPVSEKLSAFGISLPSSVNIEATEQENILKFIEGIYHTRKLNIHN
ncbi:MAG: aminotransferase class I/II-fold pyridoxal phosphate-dependent enzyme [Bacteroidota bacterium]|jgi:perosamine synthetase